MTVTDQQLNELLPAFKESLGSTADGIEDIHLQQFLRWKPNVQRATERFRAFCQWKKANPSLFDDSLRLTKDDELLRLIKSQVIVHPPGCTTNTGSPILIGRLRNNDMKDGRTVEGVCRMMFYNIDRMLEMPESCDEGITILHDLKGFSPSKNADLGIPKLLFSAIFGHFPIRIKNIYLLNAPFVFYAFFKALSTMFFPAKVKARCVFISKVDDLKDVMDTDLLLKDVGGKAELDLDRWIEANKKREQDGSLVTMTSIDPRA
ncbi:unnamed protein product [Cylindrotheca closterium]|uniref:CRAL-TRIO domain-containing protein n=1 Tax=Cylindrotheca closterium TaxID=2856 RepID=A0AAD2FUN8_9STRA|nr:unnamed protein product [Cylindrotheca closterium]